MSRIVIKNLTYSYDGSFDNIFENVNIQIDTKWKLGLVGRNGTGKTTLLSLLQGKYSFSGTIISSANFEYFPYEIKDKNQTLYEIIEKINPYYEQWKIQKELNILDFDTLDFTRPLNTYSHGEQTKILLAVLFSKDNTFLLIDEPTNHLDKTGRQVLANYLSKKTGYIIVSHDKRFLDNCIDHVMSINKAGIELQKGNLSSYIENKKRQDEFEFNENEKLKKEIKQLKKASRRTADWADKTEKTKYGGKNNKSGLRPDRGAIGAKSAKIMKRATVLKERMSESINKKSALLKNIDRDDSLNIEGKKFFKDRLLTVKKLSVIYDDNPVNQPLTFEINQGERISLTGKNGCGKTSVLKAILGQIKSYTGTIEYNRQLKLSYVCQDTSFVKGSLDEFCKIHKIDKTNLLSLLFKLGFERIQFEKPLQDFSEGQKKKLLIAKSLCGQANLYIWDEPLNYIDIISREQIKNMLIGSNVSMIFVEHDAYFCEEVSTKEIIME